MKKYTLILLVMVLGFTSCEEDVTLEFSQYEPKIVVEGFIEQGEVATVFLTKSTGYFEPLDSSQIIQVPFNGYILEVPKAYYDLLVLDATVTVTDGFVTDTLKLGFEPNKFPLIQYQGQSIYGEVGKQYVLKIETSGQVLTAKTAIPEPVPVDSLWFEFRNEEEDSLGFIHGIFQDPEMVGNYYRIMTKTKGRDSSYVHPWYAVFDDKNINGEEDTEFAIYHGNNQMEDPMDESRFYFKLGEQVRIKFCSIDYPHFRYWYTYQQNAGGGGDPFAAPAPIETNIEGGLGVWGGFGVYEIDYLVEYIDTTLVENKSRIIQ